MKVVICAAAAVALVSVSCSNQNKHGDRAEDWPGHWTRSNDPHTNITLSRHHSLQARVMKLQSSLLVSDGSGCWWWQRRVGGTINRTESCSSLLSRYLHYLPSIYYLDIYSCYGWTLGRSSSESSPLRRAGCWCIHEYEPHYRHPVPPSASWAHQWQWMTSVAECRAAAAPDLADQCTLGKNGPNDAFTGQAQCRQ